MAQEKKYYKWIDAIKGYGILLVMFMHAIGGFPHINLYLYAGYMPLFFVCSGYTISPNTQHSFYYNILKKAKRLLIPYFFYAFILNLIFSFKYLWIEKLPEIIKYEWIGILYSRYCLLPLGHNDNIIFLSLKHTSPLWFLTAMFLAYVWTYLFLSIQNKKYLILCIYILLSFILYQCPILLPWSFDISFLSALFIISGMYLRKINFSLIYILILSFIFVLLVNYNGWTNMSVRNLGNHNYLSIILFYFIGIVQTIIVTYIFRKLERTYLISIFSYIGKYSLRLMCIHMPLFTILNNFINIPNTNHYITVCFYISIAIFTCIFIDKLNLVCYNTINE